MDTLNHLPDLEGDPLFKIQTVRGGKGEGKRGKRGKSGKRAFDKACNDTGTFSTQ